MIESAIKLNASLIIFPELSITGYEPTLANTLATHIEDEKLQKYFQELSDKNMVTIGIGMPILGDAGIHIGMIIFQPNKKRTSYSKQNTTF